MKRIKQLQPLSMEHHLSLSLAAKSIKTANSGDQSAIKQLCEEIIDEYEKLWREHFDKEEQYIFTPYFQRSNTVKRLCEQLTREHEQFNLYIDQMKAGDYGVLLEFGTLLKTHTRLEERELFPEISELLSEKELDGIFEGIS